MSVIKVDYGEVGGGREPILLLFEQYNGSGLTNTYYTDSDINEYCTVTGSNGSRTLTFKQAVKGTITLGIYYAGTSVSGTATINTLNETYQGSSVQVACYTFEAEKNQTIVYATTSSVFSTISITI